jgi:hypothetical protein
MVTWDIYDQNGEWLGTCHGFTESEAISNAKIQGMTGATKAEPCED